LAGLPKLPKLVSATIPGLRVALAPFQGTNKRPLYDELVETSEIGEKSCPVDGIYVKKVIYADSAFSITGSNDTDWCSDPEDSGLYNVWLLSGLYWLGGFHEDHPISPALSNISVDQDFPVRVGSRAQFENPSYWGGKFIVAAVVPQLEAFLWLPGPFSIITFQSPNGSIDASRLYAVWSHALGWGVRLDQGKLNILRGAKIAGRQLGETADYFRRLVANSEQARQYREQAKATNQQIGNALSGFLGGLGH